MKIYTRKGDQGDTALFGGGRVKKNHPRIEAYGAVDECNSWIGLVLTEIKEDELREVLYQVQKNLFCIGSWLATPDPKKAKKMGYQDIDEAQVAILETMIDQWDAQMEPLQSFILPGGCKAAALGHMARTSCREAERHIVGLSLTEEIPESVIKYVNRLSDFFFVLARWCNFQAKHGETKWEGMK
jgi:cob(I)alamin adenosyltransferase